MVQHNLKNEIRFFYSPHFEKHCTGIQIYGTSIWFNWKSALYCIITCNINNIILSLFLYSFLPQLSGDVRKKFALNCSPSQKPHACPHTMTHTCIDPVWESWEKKLTEPGERTKDQDLCPEGAGGQRRSARVLKWKAASCIHHLLVCDVKNTSNFIEQIYLNVSSYSLMHNRCHHMLVYVKKIYNVNEWRFSGKISSSITFLIDNVEPLSSVEVLYTFCWQMTFSTSVFI